MTSKNAAVLTSKDSSISVRTGRTNTETEMSFASYSGETTGIVAGAEAENGIPSKREQLPIDDTITEEPLPCWFPKCCGKPILHGNPEALGWLLGFTGQTVVIFGVGAFLIPSLVYFARKELGCATEIPDGEDELPECNKKVRGIMKPSSLITTLSSVLSLCVALFTPLMGAIVDYTPHRRNIGRMLAVVYCAALVPQIFISESTWFPLTILLILLALVAISLTLVLHAYLPGLTDSEEELNDMTKMFMVGSGSVNIGFILAVIAVSMAFGVDGQDGPTARIAASMGLMYVVFAFGSSWGFLMQPRPAMHTLQEGQFLLTAGFKQTFQTIQKLYQQNVGLLWFFAAVALGDVKPLTGIALSFLSESQQFTSQDVGLAGIVLLLSIIPGAALSAFFSRKINPVRSSMLSLLLMVTTTCVGSIVLTGPGQKLRSFIIIACWGIFGGWKATSTNMLIAAILPTTGQDTELMGFYLFADSSLSWLPPLIFTSMNEAGWSQRVGLASISFFFVTGMLSYLGMGGYEDTVKSANRLISKDNGSMVVQLVDTEDESKEPPVSEIIRVETNDLEEQDVQDDTIRGVEVMKGEWDQSDNIHLHKG